MLHEARWGWGALAVLLLACGCTQSEQYVGTGGMYEFAMTADTPPMATTRDNALYMSELRIELPIRPPSSDTLAMLRAQAPGQMLPWSRLPWCQVHDYEIQVDWTVSNLDNNPAHVALTLNGFNEFDEYVPQFSINEQDIIPDFAQWERTFDLEPLGRKSGTIREEEMDEVATNLATVVNGAPNSNEVVYFENQSATDPRSQPYIPSVLPALTGFRIGMRAAGAVGGPAPNIVVEASVRIRDLHNRIMPNGQKSWTLPVPTPFFPVTPSM